MKRIALSFEAELERLTPLPWRLGKLAERICASAEPLR